MFVFVSVERWDGQKEDNAVKEDRTKRRRDFWDEEYDKGKVRDLFFVLKLRQSKLGIFLLF